MKRITASEARRNWFRLLDEVADGEVVVITRKGRRITIRREDARRSRRPALPDYGAILHAPDLEGADRWGWQWEGQESVLSPTATEPDDG